MVASQLQNSSHHLVTIVFPTFETGGKNGFGDRGHICSSSAGLEPDGGRSGLCSATTRAALAETGHESLQPPHLYHTTDGRREL